jgi:hypothetical protein
MVVIRRSWVPALVIALLVLSGCTQGGGGSTSTTTPAPATTSPTSASTSSECANLVAGGQALAATVAGFVGGSATGDQVRAAASRLSDAIDSAQAAIGHETGTQLDSAKQALNRLSAALTMQPPDFAAMRAAANDTLAALGAAATICQSTASTPTSTG